MTGLSDEQSKAVQEVAKVTGRTLDMVSDSVSFLHRLIGQPLEDAAGLMIGDPIRSFRVNNLIDRTAGIQKKLAEKGVLDIRVLAPKIMLPVIEHMSLEDDPVLQEMWEKLISASLDPLEEQIGKEYIHALSSMTSRDAKVLETLFERRYIGGNYHSDRHDVEKLKANGTMYSFYTRFLEKELGLDLHNVRNLLRLDVLQSTISYISVLRDPSITANDGEIIDAEEVGVSSGFEELEFSKFGLDLAIKVMG